MKLIDDPATNPTGATEVRFAVATHGDDVDSYSRKGNRMPSFGQAMRQEIRPKKCKRSSS
jgi:hypothetical protein